MSTISTALSGLSAATSDLEIISNNVANANTVGFKESTANFSDIVDANSAAGTQIGIGVRVASVDQDFTQGGVTQTGNTLDLSIQTDGFFVVNDGSSGQQEFTRAGSFHVANNGNIVNDSGDIVQGYLENNGVLSPSLTNLTISTAPVPAKATATMGFQINLDAGSTQPAVAFSSANAATYNFSTDTTIYDSLGNAHTITEYYVKAAALNTWTVHVQADNNPVDIGTGTLVFNAQGGLNTVASTGAGNLPISLVLANGATTPQALTLNYLQSTQFGGADTATSTTQDGNSAGTLTSYSVDNNGNISANYSNGQLLVLGQIAIATIPTPQGLVQNSNQTWSQSISSGTPNINPANSTGAIQSGALEESNVDLTSELVDLISAQRFFQANSQSIHAEDTVEQTIINIQ